jgi:Rieske Fe-S protein
MEHTPKHRRSFLEFALFGIGAIFSTILGIPIVSYVIDPRNRTGPASSFKLVESIKLDDLAVGVPRQGALRDTRTDGWNLYPNDVIGRVWVVMQGAKPADLDTEAKVIAYNAKPAAERSGYLVVFTTICPHLGCSINLNAAGSFTCPCHNAAFATNGDLVNLPGQPNPAARPMDTLDWKIDEKDPTFNRIEVKYVNYQPSCAEKLTVG